MISYDTNILIYALEGTSTWAKAAREIVQQGEYEGASLSVLAWQELVTGAVLSNTTAEEKLVAILNDLSATKFVPVSLSICKRAAALTKIYDKQIYGYDAIHIATAIEQKANCFITNDKKLLNLKLRELDIRSL